MATAKRKPAEKKVVVRSKAKLKTRAGKSDRALGAVDRILNSENTSMTLKSPGAIADLFGTRLEINLIDERGGAGFGCE